MSESGFAGLKDFQDEKSETSFSIGVNPVKFG